MRPFVGGLTFLVGVAMFVVAGLKIGEIGLEDYVRHLTNWSWTLQALFYTVAGILNFLADLGDYDRPRYAERSARGFNNFCFFIVNGLVWFVAIAVFVIFLYDDTLLEKADDEYGIQTTVVVNDIFHVVPVILALAYAFIYSRRLGRGLRELYRRIGPRDETSERYASPEWEDAAPIRCTCFSSFVFFLQAYVGTHIFLFFYLGIFDAGEVYYLDCPTGLSILLSLVSCTLFNAIPIAFALWDDEREKNYEEYRQRYYELPLARVTSHFPGGVLPSEPPSIAERVALNDRKPRRVEQKKRRCGRKATDLRIPLLRAQHTESQRRTTAVKKYT